MIVEFIQGAENDYLIHRKHGKDGLPYTMEGNMAVARTIVRAEKPVKCNQDLEQEKIMNGVTTTSIAEIYRGKKGLNKETHGHDPKVKILTTIINTRSKTESRSPLSAKTSPGLSMIGKISFSKPRGRFI